MRIFRGLGASFLLLGLFTVPVFAQRPTLPSSNNRSIVTFSIRGTVRDAVTYRDIDDVQVDLRVFGGGLLASMVSGFSGDFEFDGLGSGEYYLNVRVPGYQPVNQVVLVDGFSVSGILVLLKKKQEEHGESTAPTVSKRELLIPRKAHDAMMKGYRLLYEKSDAKGSLKEFERAAQAYPDYYEAYAQMGVADMKLGDNAGAEKALRKSLELSHESYATALWLLAMDYTNGKRFADAEPLARKAVALDQNAWQAKFELSRALLGLNRYTDAETSALAAARLEPDSGPVHLLLANIHMHTRNYPALVDDLNAYLKIAPKGATADKARTLRDKVQQALATAKAAPPAMKETAPSP
jgi:Flp pilus assembly protein TadD